MSLGDLRVLVEAVAEVELEARLGSIREEEERVLVGVVPEVEPELGGNETIVLKVDRR